LGEPLGGAEGLLEAVSFKKVMESMGRAASCCWLSLLYIHMMLDMKKWID